MITTDGLMDNMNVTYAKCSKPDDPYTYKKFEKKQNCDYIYPIVKQINIFGNSHPCVLTKIERVVEEIGAACGEQAVTKVNSAKEVVQHLRCRQGIQSKATLF